MATITKEVAQQKMDTLHKLARSNPKELTTHFHEKAKLMANHYENFVGKDAIEQYYRKRSEMDPTQEFDLRFMIDEVITKTDVGVCDGHYDLMNTKSGEKKDHGKFLVIFEKTGGDWKIFRLMYNTSTPHHAHHETH